MSKVIRTQKPSVLPWYAAALVFAVLCAALPAYKLWALLIALGGAAVMFGAAKKVCPPRVVEHEVPFHTGSGDVDEMLACFVGFGGAKLRAKYDTVKNEFTTGVAADSGYSLNEELTTRLNTAANIITTASNTLGADSTEVQTAQAALDSFSACLGAVQSDGKIHAPDSLSVYTGGRMHMLYQSNETLGTAIGQLYAKLQEQAADPMKMGAVQGQYSQFNGAQTIISNLHYNDAVQSYQKDVGGFPASVLGKLFGIQEVELFA